ncbi:MFS transporter [Pendulispora brunnea]|uniref:MFS transporter n=1 Tax=Pendulispora brunnea TaxID=2905690 RepID=A0ABZ2K5V5_9BACT
MKLKSFLVSTTAIAVVSDSMLIPFYPQFFADAFGVTDPRHVGIYLAATCFTVMLAFPGWALLAKKVPPLRVLLFTQLAAGLLSIGCYGCTNVVAFWLVSLGMLVFKASYLLIYPYVMSLEDKANHAATIGLLSVIVHLGGIAGALLGGAVLQAFEPRHAFLVMAAGDFLQMGVCLFSFGSAAASKGEPVAEAAPSTPARKGMVHRLGLVMFVFYFSAFLVRPFFATYWESISSFRSPVVAGFVFAIPGLVALLALWLRKGDTAIPLAIVLGTLGLLLQAAPFAPVVLVGRCVFGWALFHAIVKLDLLLFELSTPESYATDFSKINICQQLGVLVSSFTAGTLVVSHGLRIPFFAAAVGFVLTLVSYGRLLAPEKPKTADKEVVVIS